MSFAALSSPRESAVLTTSSSSSRAKTVTPVVERLAGLDPELLIGEVAVVLPLRPRHAADLVLGERREDVAERGVVEATELGEASPPSGCFPGSPSKSTGRPRARPASSHDT